MKLNTQQYEPVFQNHQCHLSGFVESVMKAKNTLKLFIPPLSLLCVQNFILPYDIRGYSCY
ncbi:hypothetical protein SAMN04488136_105134 [Vibrio xiamenensis]|uniref:Uncharacterized protein n=1 Tax=Vibrio xiamenensis TaxID=861298 RepID=A0A1G7YHU0_9VIBR|nr:hypothetical protein SAMN04488136_105134 [Vibrio xiamenensis]